MKNQIEEFSNKRAYRYLLAKQLNYFKFQLFCKYKRGNKVF